MLEKTKCFILDHTPKGISRVYSNLKHGGANYYCPCCKRWFPQMMDNHFGDNPTLYNPDRYKKERQDVMCPRCGSLPRHRILVSWIGENVALFRNKRILHFAQELSIKLFLDRNHIPVTTADLFKKADLKIDLLDTGLPDKSYDIVICNHVLEHVDDYKKRTSRIA